jgi:phosphoserine phosphatase
MNDRALRYPLVCFDLDGTLVDDTIFIWKTLHEHFATDTVKRENAHRDYFAGRIAYREWFECDLELLIAAGATRARIFDLLDDLRLMPFAVETLNELKERGHKLAIISGSLDVVVEHLLGEIEFDHVLINHIEFDSDGRISGGAPTPYDLKGKADGLVELCRREGISTSRAAFVGDNSNDVWIARKAGLAIAFNCRSEELRAVCDREVRQDEMRLIPDLLL